MSNQVSTATPRRRASAWRRPRTAAPLALFGPSPRELLLYDPVARKVFRRLTVPKPHRFMRVALSPDGAYLAADLWDDRIQVWDVRKEEDTHTTLKHDGIKHLTCTRDGKTLFSASASEVPVKRWNAPDWKERVAVWPGKDGGAVAFAPDGNTAARATEQKVEVLDLATGKVPATFAAGVAGGKGTFSRDGKALLCAPAHGSTAFLIPDTAEGKSVRKSAARPRG